MTRNLQIGLDRGGACESEDEADPKGVDNLTRDVRSELFKDKTPLYYYLLGIRLRGA